MTITIREAAHTDLPNVAQCHRQAFPNALSSAMGSSYVQKMLEWYLVDDRAFLFLAFDGDQCVGYCGGMKVDARIREGSASSMIQYSFRNAVMAIVSRPWLVLHSEFLNKYSLVLRNLWKKAKGIFTSSVPTVKIDPDRQVYCGLVVIGVRPSHRGAGCGSQLIHAFEKKSQSMGVETVRLSVRADNRNAINAYLRNEWKIESQSGKFVSMYKSLVQG
jgi:ribosomal protein S18 acetylase RimI-like enzyme